MKANKTRLLILPLFLFAACVAAAAGLAGNWVGESICVIKDSPCHDEHVIYHITEPDSSGKLTIQADKVVNGKPEDMGTLDCTFEKSASKVTCRMDKGIWEFVVSGNTMKGTLKLTDGSLFRNISVKKED